MNNKSNTYEINEKDIDTVINFLKKTDPDNATPEKSTALLEDLQAEFHKIGHDNPMKLEEMLEGLQKSKKIKNEDKD